MFYEAKWAWITPMNDSFTFQFIEMFVKFVQR